MQTWSVVEGLLRRVWGDITKEVAAARDNLWAFLWGMQNRYSASPNPPDHTGIWSGHQKVMMVRQCPRVHAQYTHRLTAQPTHPPPLTEGTQAAVRPESLPLGHFFFFFLDRLTAYGVGVPGPGTRQGSDPSHTGNVCHSCSNAGSFNLLCEVGDWTCVLMLQRWCQSLCTTGGTPLLGT